MPAMASATANDTRMPSMYALMTKGSCSGEKTVRRSPAPVPITSIGGISGAVSASRFSSVLANADWAAEMLKAPPMIWKTKGHVSMP